MKTNREEKAISTNKDATTPNALSIKTINAARGRKRIGKPIKNIRTFIDSL
ncbi:MAG TPA: hypothetical protein VNX40_04835 [Mucilaginibacter sp.]|jgi:hypothetical protein|nr:hypothetical protein [Mucilaginibacter sp.]